MIINLIINPKTCLFYDHLLSPNLMNRKCVILRITHISSFSRGRIYRGPRRVCDYHQCPIVSSSLILRIFFISPSEPLSANDLSANNKSKFSHSGWLFQIWKGNSCVPCVGVAQKYKFIVSYKLLKSLFVPKLSESVHSLPPDSLLNGFVFLSMMVDGGWAIERGWHKVGRDTRWAPIEGKSQISRIGFLNRGKVFSWDWIVRSF